MHCVILAGGVGTRLKPYTTVIPKPLMPIGEYSILEIILRQLKYAGVTRITLSVGYLAELIMAYCGNGKKFGIEIEYIKEDKPLGTGGVIGLMENIQEQFILMNGDLLTSIDFKDLYSYHTKRKCFATVAIFEREIKTEFGVVTIDKDGYLSKYDEKPVIKQLVSTGIYALSPEVKNFISANQRIDMPELLKLLLDAGQKVDTYEFQGDWLDIGRHADYDMAVAEFNNKKEFFLKTKFY
jgi:NDP-sugar pyrophosphorylase family protein